MCTWIGNEWKMLVKAAWYLHLVNKYNTFSLCPVLLISHCCYHPVLPQTLLFFEPVLWCNKSAHTCSCQRLGVNWAQPTLMQLLQLFSFGDIAWAIESSYYQHSGSIQQLLTSPLYCNHTDFSFCMQVWGVRLRRCFHLRKAVYVGDVTFNQAAFSSAIIYGCSLLFPCLIPPFVWIRPPVCCFPQSPYGSKWMDCRF